MIIRNFTPHPVSVYRRDGSIVTYEIDGSAPRAEMGRAELGEVTDQNGDKIEFSRSWTEDEIVGFLPEPVEGTVLIVARMVAELPCLAWRDDLVCPDTAPGMAIRNDAGTVVGCRKLTYPKK